MLIEPGHIVSYKAHADRTRYGLVEEVTESRVRGSKIWCHWQDSRSRVGEPSPNGLRFMYANECTIIGGSISEENLWE